MPHISPATLNSDNKHNASFASTSESFQQTPIHVVLKRHLAACEAHYDFLHECKRARPSICSTLGDLGRLGSMIESASKAVAQAREINVAWGTPSKKVTGKQSEQNGTASSPDTKLPVRNKRVSFAPTDEEHAPKTKKRKSSGRAAKDMKPTRPTGETPQPSANESDPGLEVEYADITDEVNERIQAREQRRQAGIQTGTPVVSKRKRRSSGAVQTDGVENAGEDDDMERAAKRRGRTSIGGTRQIKKLKIKSTDGPSIANSTTQQPEAVASEAQEVAAKKKRRRSTAVGGASAGENRFAGDDRAVKRRRR
jgi:hypothetical protein